MNIYRTSFTACCPNNGASILYSLEIKTTDLIEVESITAYTKAISAGFHESIATDLALQFGGSQRLIATHHGVEIETLR